MLMVTGGAGFIGGHFIEAYLPFTPILNIDRVNTDVLSILNHPNYHFEGYNLGIDHGLESIMLRYKPQACVHFAAETHVDTSIVHPERFFQSNVIGTLHLLEAIRFFLKHASCSKAFKMLHISTDEVYGMLQMHDMPVSEGAVYHPNNPYAASKAASDHMVHAWCHTYDVPVIVAHATNNYGTRQHIEKMIPRMITCALQHQPMPIFGTGTQVRDWLYVLDHVSALKCILEKGIVGETYHISTYCERKNRDVVALLCDMLDTLAPSQQIQSYRELMTHVEDRAGHDIRYALNAEKLERELGWRGVGCFEQHLQTTIQWYVSQNKNSVYLK